MLFPCLHFIMKVRDWQYNVRYELNKHIMVQAKYGMTHYLNRDVIGSALEAIDGSTKGDLYLQLRMKF